MNDPFGNRVYYKLLVSSKDPTTKIYVADEDGHLVVSGLGQIDELLAEGCYNVHFGIKGKPRLIKLNGFVSVNE